MASDPLVPVPTCLPEAVGRAGAVRWHQRVGRDEGVCRPGAIVVDRKAGMGPWGLNGWFVPENH